MARTPRPDMSGTHRGAYEKNKKKIFASQNVCGICGREVDFSLKFPDPWCPTVDHIIPVDKGGHPSDLSNLQLAHFRCNRQKSNKITKNDENKHEDELISNRILPQSLDWISYRSKQGDKDPSRRSPEAPP